MKVSLKTLPEAVHPSWESPEMPDSEAHSPALPAKRQKRKSSETSTGFNAYSRSTCEKIGPPEGTKCGFAKRYLPRYKGSTRAVVQMVRTAHGGRIFR